MFARRLTLSITRILACACGLVLAGILFAGTITGDTEGSVVEDSLALIASGDLDSEADDGSSLNFLGQGIVGNYGALVIQTTGAWIYTLDGTDSDTNALGAGDMATDRFVVQDSEGDVATIAINVAGANDSPTADAGDPQTVTDNSAVVLDGSGSDDPEGSLLTYSWSEITSPSVGINLSANDVESPTFTAPESSVDYEIVFELSVSDGSLSNTDTVTIDVDVDNDPPIADAGDEQNAVEGDTVALDGSRSRDPEGAALTYVWGIGTPLPGLSLSSTNSVRTTFVAPNRAANYLAVFSLLVSDGVQSRTAMVTVNVTANNDRPDADAGDPQTVGDGDTVMLDGSGSDDPEGSPLTYSWSEITSPSVGINLSANDVESPTFTAPESSVDYEIVFELSVSDNNLSHTDTVTISVEVDNDPPMADAGDEQNAVEGDTVALDGSRSRDPEGAALTYVWGIGTPLPGLSLSSTNSVRTTFVAPNRAANYPVVFSLLVSDGELSSTAMVTVNVLANNDGPTADAGDDQDAVEGDTVMLDGSDSSDPEDTPLTFLWEETSTTGAELSADNIVNPTFIAPDRADDYSIIFALTATDSGGLPNTALVTINVSADNALPVADAGETQTVGEDDTVTLNGLDSTDPDTDTSLNYAWTEATNPSVGVTLSDANIAKPTFEPPNRNRNYSIVFELTITDSAGEKDMALVTISVNADNDTPSAVASADQRVKEGDTVALNASASSDPDGDNLNYRWTQLLGAAVTLSSDTAESPTFVAPNRASAYEIVFELQVSDGGLSDKATVTIAVNATNQEPLADAGPNQTIVRGGRPVTLNGSASTDPDGGALRYSWRQTQGTPVTLSATNIASPTFNTSDLADGDELVFELTVTDPGDESATATVTITITSVDDLQLHRAILPEVAAAVSRSVASSIHARAFRIIEAPQPFDDPEKWPDNQWPRQPQLKTRCANCNFTFWGHAGAQGLSDSVPNNDYEGELYNAQLGLDFGVGKTFLIGALVNSTRGEFDYTQAGAPGVYDLELLTLHPYLVLRFYEGRLKLWGSAGFGTGESNLDSESISTDTDLEFASWSLGGAYSLFKASSTGFHLKVDLALAEIKADTDRATISNESIRTRVAFEVHNQTTNEGGGQMSRIFALGLLVEDGDGSLQEGVEFASGINYQKGRVGLSAGLYGLTDAEDYEQWGASARFRLEASRNSGWQVSFSSVYGTPREDAHALWQEALPETGRQTAPLRFESEIGYRLESARGPLTPYLASSFTFSDGSHTAGIRWQPLRRLDLDFGHMRSSADDRLRMRIRYRF